MELVRGLGGPDIVNVIIEIPVTNRANAAWIDSRRASGFSAMERDYRW